VRDAPRAAKRHVEATFVERLLQILGFPHVGMQRSMIERIDRALNGFEPFEMGQGLGNGIPTAASMAAILG
jgi:hypothetical protein